MNASSTSTAAPTTLDDRELTRIEFYKTYDVMTGVRIAATLGGFFSLMVLLVVYKSKCKGKSLSDEQLWPRAPTSRASTRRCSASRSPQLPLPMAPVSVADPVVVEDEEDPCPYHQYLTVPGDSRRLSSITCSSSDTSYLERRGSAIEMGIPAPPPYRLRMGSPMPEEPWDFYYPIDIQVIQPTPEISPCGSEHTLYHRVASARLAPLASISTCAGSIGSDSVFLRDDGDTEDEVDGFSSDSETSTVGPAGSSYVKKRPPCPLPIGSSSSSSGTLKETPF